MPGILLDPDAAALAAALAGAPTMRVRGINAVRQTLESVPRPPELPVMAATEDHVTADGIALRVHRPVLDEELPVIVYLHGGGMCMGSNDSFEPVARYLAHDSGAVVVAVEYRLAPEHPPSAQFDDAWAATCWVADHATTFGVDPARVAVAGDSAGGTLAAAVALAARDRGGPAIACQVLIYPGLDRDMTVDSMTRFADAPILSSDDVRYLNELADAGQGPLDHPYRIPAYATDLTGLPPAIVVTAECDPIRDWGERYAARLREARVQTTHTRYPGLLHGFALQAGYLARGRLALAETGALLKTKLAHPLPF